MHAVSNVSVLSSTINGVFALHFHVLAAHLQLFGSLSSLVPISGLPIMYASPQL